MGIPVVRCFVGETTRGGAFVVILDGGNGGATHRGRGDRYTLCIFCYRKRIELRLERQREGWLLVIEKV